MGGNLYIISATAVMALVTLLLRVLPFVLLGGREIPPYVTYLGSCLPYAIMGMLVVYCLKGVTPLTFPFGIPEAVSVLTVAALHVWKRNTLLSIVSGTAIYMLLTHFVF